MYKTCPLLKALIALMPCIVIGCLSLDSFLFSGKRAENYQFDHYTGNQECRSFVTQYGPFDTALIRVFTMTSGNESIAGVFLLRGLSDSILSSSDTLIMYFHGKADNIDLYWARIRMLWTAGYPVAAVDYRGFGMSTGKTTEQTLYEDARAALRYIYDSLGNPRVIVYGYSLGSIPGCEIASHDADHQVIMLVLEAPIGKAETIVENGTLLSIPGSYLTSYSADNAKKIKSVFVPLLWLHGTKDETLNRETHGLPLWNNYPDPEHRGRYVVINGSTHTTIPQTMSADYYQYINSIRHFIRDSTSASIDPWFHSK